MEYATIQKEQILNFKPTKEQIKATEKVFFNMVNVEIIKEIVLKYQKEILEKHKFKFKEKYDEEEYYKITFKKYIINPEHYYLMKDSDFKVYLNECYLKAVDNGFKLKSKEYCPLLIAQSNLIDSQNKLIDLFGPITHIKRGRVYLKNRTNLIELTLKLMAKYINKENINKIIKENAIKRGF